MKTDIKQLIWILSTGIGIIISMLVFENMGIGSIASIGQEKRNSFQELQSEINLIPNKNWDPVGYSTLSAKIHTAKENNSITADDEIVLQKTLDLYYKDKLTETTERYLHTSNGDFGKILKALNQLLNSPTISNDDKLDLNKLSSTMVAFNNYTEILPSQVSSFIGRGVGNFDEVQLNSLLNKIDNLSSLILPYSNNSKIQSIQNSTRNALMQFQGEYVSSQISW
jgi:hypothetical protein